MTVIRIPRQRSPAYLDEAGVNSTGANLTPGTFLTLRVRASRSASIQGAPRSSNGASVPRPTETFVVSRSATPG